MPENQTPAPAPANMPRTRAQVARSDPQPRPVAGFGEIRLVNPREDRRYCLVDKGAGQGRELINPHSMAARGWEFERWESVDGGKGYGGWDQLYKPAPGALHFEGGALVGPNGSVIEHSGCVLMSIDKDLWEAQKAEGQRFADPRERAIRTNEMQAQEARHLLKRAGVRPDIANVSQMSEDDIARVG